MDAATQNQQDLGSGKKNVGGNAGDREIQEIESRFNPNPRPLTVDQKEILAPIMFTTKDLATNVVEKIPNNRERAIALSHLQEFTWAVEKGILNPSSY